MSDNHTTESDYRETEAEKEINRKLNALKGAIVMLVKASLYTSDAMVIMEDLDEVWDEN